MVHFRAPRPRQPRDERLVQQHVLYAAAASMSVVVGLAAGVAPSRAIEAGLAATFLWLIAADLVVGVGVLVLAGFLEQFSQVAGALSIAKGVGILLAAAWAVTLAMARSDERDEIDLLARHPFVAAAIVLLVAWAGVSVVWATSHHAVTSAATRLTLNLALFPIAFAAIRTRAHMIGLYGTFIVGALISVGYGLTIPPDPSSPTLGRLNGAGLDANQLGGLLVVAITLSVGLASIRSIPRGARVAAVVAGFGCAAGLFLTESRGALVGLATVIVVAPLLAGPGRRAAALAAGFVVLTTAACWFAFVASPAAVERITHPQAAGGSGREDLWTVGLRMVEAHPLDGVGAGNFPIRSVDFLLRPGLTQRDVYIVDRPLVPHNIYLNVLAELGLVGLLLFLFIIGSCIIFALGAARRFASSGAGDMDILARALCVGLVAYLTADFFSSQLYNKELWLLLSFAPALLALSRRRPYG